MNIGDVFKLHEYQPIPSYRALREMDTNLGCALFTNETCRFTVLDAILFFNALLQRFPTTPISAVDSILKWIHSMTQFSRLPESYEGLNSCITTTERIISVPFCSTKGCGHIFDPNLDLQQACPKCGKDGFTKAATHYTPISTFYYSPVIWKEMDLIIHNPQFCQIIQRLLPDQTHDSNQIANFVDAEQYSSFMSEYARKKDTLCLALSEMVDGVSRSLCTPENMTVQMVCYASLPLTERNKYSNIFVTAVCRSEDQPHANIFRRMLVGELQFTK